MSCRKPRFIWEVWAYTLGKPAQAVDPDTLDLHEWELYRRLPDPGPEMLAATTRPGLPFALEYLRTVLPGVADDQLRQFCEAAAARKAEEELEAAARAERAARRRERAERRQQSADAPLAAEPTPPSVNGRGAPSANGSDGRDRPPAGDRLPSTNGVSGTPGSAGGACDPQRPPE
jgi:hypothetical protein